MVKRCWICRKPCPEPFKTFQNTKAMYLSERKPTYLHEQCWKDQEAFAEQERAELAARLEAMRA